LSQVQPAFPNKGRSNQSNHKPKQNHEKRGNVSANKSIGDFKKKSNPIIVSTNPNNGRQEIINRITTLMGVIELSAGEVADRFNKEGLTAPDGSYKWNEEMVLDLYEDEIL
jgi:hypothetical protein